MEQPIKNIVFLLALFSLLFFTGCSGSGGGSTAVYSGIYSGYGYGDCCYDDIDVDIDRPDRDERIERRENARTQAASSSRSSAGMGRPARMSRGGGGRRR